VGVAISPAQHSFYSALHSGLGVEKYDAPYWRKRGRARFYRYVKAAPATVHADARIAPMTATTFGGAESHDDPEKNGMKTQPPTAPLEVRATNLPIARLAVVDSEQPGAAEITEALSQAFSDTAAALRERDVLTLPRPLIAFDRIEVERVHIERGQGWAAVKIRRPLPVTAEQVKHRKPPERQGWLLRRAGSVQLGGSAPGERYLPSAGRCRTSTGSPAYGHYR
jgi:hypothetical protein